MKLQALIALIFSNAGLLGMRMPEARDFSCCNSIKQLRPGVSLESDWYACVQDLHNHHISVAEAITYLTNKRVEKAFEGVIKEHSITPQELALLESSLQNMRQRDSQLSPGGLFSGEFPNQVKELVRQKYEECNFNVPLVVHIWPDDIQNAQTVYVDAIAKVSRGVSDQLEVQDYMSLYIREGFIKSLPQNSRAYADLDAVLQHEFTHIKNEDTIKSTMLYVLYKHRNHDSADQERHSDLLLKSSSWQKWTRAFEARADRQGQVLSNSMQTIENMAIFEYVNLQRAQNNNFDVCTHAPDPEHPPIAKRFDWAAKIHSLCIIEQELKEATRQQS